MFRNVDVEDFVAGLLRAVLEIVGESLIEILFGLAAEALGALIGSLQLTNPMVLAVALALVGAAAGLLSSALELVSCWHHSSLASRWISWESNCVISANTQARLLRFVAESCSRFRWP